MKIYLVQHGDADPKQSNPDRPLSERGREEVTRVAEFAAQAGLHLAEIRHSGKLRAKQTAEIFGEHLAPANGVAVLTGIGPKDDPAPIGRAFAEEDDDVMLVSHMPFLERLAAHLMAGEPSTRPLVHFEKGGIVCFERTADGSYSLAWAMTPSLLASPPPPSE